MIPGADEGSQAGCGVGASPDHTQEHRKDHLSKTLALGAAHVPWSRVTRTELDCRLGDTGIQSDPQLKCLL